LIWTGIATLCVGFCKEIVYRGIIIVEFKNHNAEWQVRLNSSLLFGLAHIWNSLEAKKFK
jgi:membrane protease YdiL (CAAX protease family)